MGSKGAPPPDYEPLERASKEAAEIQAGLGREQLAFAREQYDRSAPNTGRYSQPTDGRAKRADGSSRDYYNYQRDTFRPVERGLVADAQRFNTQDYQQPDGVKSVCGCRSGV